jgi:hypothetical protein
MTEKTKVEIAQDEYAEARQNIVEYIEDTCQKRVALASAGHIRQVMTVLSAEMSLAGALGQIDTVRHLGALADHLMHAEATLTVTSSEDYQRTFGDDLDEDTDTFLRR